MAQACCNIMFLSVYVIIEANPNRVLVLLIDWDGHISWFRTLALFWC